MKIKIALLLTAAAALAGCAAETSNTPANKNVAVVVNNNANVAQPAGTVSPAKPELSAMLSDAKLGVDDKIKAINTYVDGEEAMLEKLTRKETMLKPDALKGVTEQSWAKIHSYSEGTALRRLKAYPLANSQKSEEFYYASDKLVYVFVEPQGAGKNGPDSDAKGERYYFGPDGLIAWVNAEGKRADANSADFKKMGEKLHAESEAFRKAAQ